MLPQVIVHNAISLDGSLTGFPGNLPLYYRLAGEFGAGMHLVGSNTARKGIEMFYPEVPPERAEDRKKPGREGILWAIPDSGGKLQGLLHVFRQVEYCKDVVILVSETTPAAYIRYLMEREYDHYIVGQDQCDLKYALELLGETYGVSTVLTDTGSILSNHLLAQGLVDEISLLVHPLVAGKPSYPIFGHMGRAIGLRLTKSETFEGGYLWLVYKVLA